MSNRRSTNISEATNTFGFLSECVKSTFADVVSWNPHKSGRERTGLILALMSYWRIQRGEHVFLNPRHLKSVMNYWRKWRDSAEEESYRKTATFWIRLYEQRLKFEKRISELGERFVDLSSSVSQAPICFSFILEYEASPYWSEIIYDFRKLLSVLAPLKVGIFHLPKYFSTSNIWEYGKNWEIEWKDKVLDSDKPDELIGDMENELKLNTLEHPDTVYLIILIHSRDEKSVDLHGHLLWKETTGEIHSEKLTM